MTPNYIRLIEFIDGSVWIDMPGVAYQTAFAQTGVDNCPAPRPLQDRTDYTMRVLSWAAYQALVTDPAAVIVEQLYYDNAELKIDTGWQRQLMYPSLILQKHLARLGAWIDTELAKEVPDAVQVQKWQRDKDRASAIRRQAQDPATAQQALLAIYQIALDSLQYAEAPKLAIQQKLQAKIQELQGE